MRKIFPYLMIIIGIGIIIFITCIFLKNGYSKKATAYEDTVKQKEIVINYLQTRMDSLVNYMFVIDTRNQLLENLLNKYDSTENDKSNNIIDIRNGKRN